MNKKKQRQTKLKNTIGRSLPKINKRTTYIPLESISLNLFFFIIEEMVV